MWPRRQRGKCRRRRDKTISFATFGLTSCSSCVTVGFDESSTKKLEPFSRKCAYSCDNPRYKPALCHRQGRDEYRHRNVTSCQRFTRATRGVLIVVAINVVARPLVILVRQLGNCRISKHHNILKGNGVVRAFGIISEVICCKSPTWTARIVRSLAAR